MVRHRDFHATIASWVLLSKLSSLIASVITPLHWSITLHYTGGIPKNQQEELDIYLELGGTDINMVAKNTTRWPCATHCCQCGSNVRHFWHAHNTSSIWSPKHTWAQLDASVSCTNVHLWPREKGNWAPCTSGAVAVKLFKKQSLLALAPPLDSGGDTSGTTFTLWF